MKKATSKDVAKLAGVSQTTVSFVLNNRSDKPISKHTREKVLEAAKTLQYIPNSFAVGLKTNQSKLFGLILPTITNPYYPMLTQYIEEYAASIGYNLLLCNIYRRTENEAYYINLLAEKGVDGIIFAFTPKSDAYDKLSRAIPAVIIGEKDSRIRLPAIELDSEIAGALVAQHLIELGHKRIAFVTGPSNGFTLSRNKRLQGVIAKLKEYNLDQALIVKTVNQEIESKDSTYEIELGFNLTYELLEKENITAIIGVNDMVAFGAINAIQAKNLNVPRDLSVCGFDNIYLSNVLYPRITTVEHQLCQRCQLAVDILIDQIKNNQEIESIPYPSPQLVCRESTANARKD